LLDVNPAESVHTAGANPPDFILTRGESRTAFAWTPDGRSLVFVGRTGDRMQLYVRALDREESRPLPGTEDAQVPTVSPDGRWIVFYANRALRRVSLAGGPVGVIGPLHGPPDRLAWARDGAIFCGGRTIRQIGPQGTTDVTRLRSRRRLRRSRRATAPFVAWVDRA
jgi:hypothetical protein